MKLNKIRENFLDFFQEKHHKIIPSSPLVPNNDTSLLFTNSGMVQFKDMFLGLKNSPYKRATSSQGCIRAGGKHNDLENVGYTSRHHTFFEMLGNFSFGDYFKKEAIGYSWDFLTNILKIDPKKLYVTVLKEDKESADIWLSDVGISQNHISYKTTEDNFWTMGATGPCGPCTEIFYDYGRESNSLYKKERYVEVWNIVFMQFFQNSDGTKETLPKFCVDTGMGLERIAAVLQNVQDNYHIDLFQNLLKKLSKIVGCCNFENKSMRVIVDHIRSSGLLILEGVNPSNDKHGYVVRRIIRRAIRHGSKLGQKKPFLYKLIPFLAEEMHEAYPKLLLLESHIKEVIYREEEQFIKTLDKGIKIFEEEIGLLTSHKVPGELAFKLYDTYGFPLDLTMDLSKDYGYSVEKEDFEKCMKQRKKQSKHNSSFQPGKENLSKIACESKFLGNSVHSWISKISKIFKEEQEVQNLQTEETGTIILDHSPFYPEAGGQIGDIGYISSDFGVFFVSSTKKIKNCVIHYGKVIKGFIGIKESVHSSVDISRRKSTAINHSATHLLHSALREKLGSGVEQKGSLVTEERIRFDFSYTGTLSHKDIQEIESIANNEIKNCNLPEISEINHKYIDSSNVIALFDISEHQDFIRVIRFGSFSSEACCGTHVENIKDVILIKIVSYKSVAAGIKRIEAVAGKAALNLLLEKNKELEKISKISNAGDKNIYEKVGNIIDKNNENIKIISKIQKDFALEKVKNILKDAKKICGINVLCTVMNNMDSRILNFVSDSFKSNPTSLVTLLLYEENNKNLLISTVSKDCLSFINAVDLIKLVGGDGGGRRDIARGTLRILERCKTEFISNAEFLIKQKIEDSMRARKDSNLRPPSS